MPQFDLALWKDRATTRFQKALVAGRETAGAKLLRDMLAIEKIPVVLAWCVTRKLEVVFGKKPNGLYEPAVRKITVNGRLEPESQLYVLLHECGHHLIGVREPGERYGNGYQADDQTTRTLIHRVDVVEEELEAWHRGLKLAKRLKIDVNLDRYNRTRAEYVKSYLKWAARAAKPSYKDDTTDGDET